jgi:hypothetical protein
MEIAISADLSSLILGEQWPELLGVLFQASQNPEAGLRETAFRVFTTTPGIIERQHEDAVIEVFGKGFKDDNISVCHKMDMLHNLSSVLTITIGSDFRHGSLRFSVPIHLQKVTPQILWPHARPLEHPASSQRVL